MGTGERGVRDRVGSTVVRARWRPPQLGEIFVRRERLERMLDTGVRGPLTLIVAPAGYGKTSLIASWAERAALPVAWLAVAEDDRDPRTLIAHMLTAMQTAAPDFGQRLQSLIQMEDLPEPGRLGEVLAAEADELVRDVVLVLDDLHLAACPGVHALLQGVLAFPPPRLHLVITTRSAPEIGLGLARARGQVVDIAAADLRFGEAEVAMVFERAVEQATDPDVVRLVAERTEGWAACVRLAATAFRQQPFSERFVEEFGQAPTPHVMAFLLDEVYAKLSAPLRTLLLSTAIVDRVCADLCAVLMQDDDVEIDPLAVLREVSTRDIYVAPIDAERTWFRYHPLFRDVMRHRLVALIGETGVRRQHARASAWFEEHGDWAAAIHHALRAGEPGRAADLAATASFDSIERERWMDIAQWLGPLPDEVIWRRPDLLVARCWLRRARGGDSGYTPDVERALAMLDAPGGDDLPHARRSRGHLHAFAIMARIASRAASDVQAAMPVTTSLIPAADSTALGLSLEIAALALTVDGQFDAALAMLAPYVEGRQTARIGARVRTSASWLNIRYQARGELPTATPVGGQLQALVLEADLPVSRAWARNAFGIHYLQGLDYDSAMREFQALMDQRTPPTVTLWTQGLRGLALCHLLAGRCDEARDFAEQAVRLAEDTTSVMLQEGARSFEARIRLDQGDPEPAIAWARQAPALVDQELPIYIESMALTRVRALFASSDAGDRRAAWIALRQHIDRVRAWGLAPAETFARAVEAVMHAAEGRDDEALAALATPLHQAETHGLLLPIVELGDPMLELLEQLPDAQAAMPAVQRCIEALSRRSQRRAAVGKTAMGPALGDPLSEREIDVVRLLELRLTNREIGERLFISPLTVKRHLANIAVKLGTPDRLTAFTRARDLGLLAVKPTQPRK